MAGHFLRQGPHRLRGRGSGRGGGDGIIPPVPATAPPVVVGIALRGRGALDGGEGEEERRGERQEGETHVVRGGCGVIS